MSDLSTNWTTLPDGFSSTFVRKYENLWREALLHELTSANIIPENYSPSLVEFQDTSAWSRGGAETYICSFSVAGLAAVKEELPTTHFVAKALVTSGGSIAKKADEWFDRALRLHEFGVKTATKGAVKGSIYQEYIPERFEDLLKSMLDTGDHASALDLSSRLGSLTRSVERAGYQPLELLTDLRVGSKQLYLIDLGSDLGPYRTSATTISRLVTEELSATLAGSRHLETMLDAWNQAYKSNQGNSTACRGIPS